MAQQVRGHVLTRRKAKQALDNGQLQLQRTFQHINFLESPVEMLVCDIENSIAPRGQIDLSDSVLNTFARAFEAGYRYIILRTNKKRKEKHVGIEDEFIVSGDFTMMTKQLEELGFDVVLLRQPQWVWWPIWALGKWPRKPWRATFRSDLGQVQDYLIASGKTPLSSSQIMVVGDKVRFDVLRPLLMGWNAVLVNPIGSDGMGDKFALIRPIERFTLWRLGLKRPS